VICHGTQGHRGVGRRMVRSIGFAGLVMGGCVGAREHGRRLQSERTSLGDSPVFGDQTEGTQAFIESTALPSCLVCDVLMTWVWFLIRIVDGNGFTLSKPGVGVEEEEEVRPILLFCLALGRFVASLSSSWHPIATSCHQG